MLLSVARLGATRGHVLVGLLVAVNVVLVGVALGHSSPTVATGAVVPGPTPSAHGPVTLISASAARALGPMPPERFSAANTKIAWRAHGGCSGAPALAATQDGGLTFVDLPTPDTYVLQVGLTGAKTGWIVGASAQCQPAYFSTRNGGRTWAVVGTLNDAWTPFGSGLLTPAATSTTPCHGSANTPFAVAGGGARTAIVICRRGVVRTTNGGRSWRSTGRFPRGRPVAVALTPGGRGLLALAHSAHCSGARVALTDDAGSSWSPGPCLSNATAPVVASLAPSGRGLLVSPGYLFRTQDAGASWS
jgi:photosystem II stability/assembly factor-like uncharacterized protein